MPEFIMNNIATIAVGAAVAAVTAAVAAVMIKRRKSGKSSCGCDCSHCSARCKYKK